jgi:hypothetical protein
MARGGPMGRPAITNLPVALTGLAFVALTGLAFVAAPRLARGQASAPWNDPEFVKAVEWRRQGRDQEAYRTFLRLYARTHAPCAQAQVGLALEALGRLAEALAALEAALDHPDAWVNYYRQYLAAEIAKICIAMGTSCVAHDAGGPVPDARVDAAGPPDSSDGGPMPPVPSDAGHSAVGVTDAGADASPTTPWIGLFVMIGGGLGAGVGGVLLGTSVDAYAHYEHDVGCHTAVAGPEMLCPDKRATANVLLGGSIGLLGVGAAAALAGGLWWWLATPSTSHERGSSPQARTVRCGPTWAGPGVACLGTF